MWVSCEPTSSMISINCLIFILYLLFVFVVVFWPKLIVVQLLYIDSVNTYGRKR